jgi:hypothetical protein
MSDINPREIFVRRQTKRSRFSVQRSGIWGFENYNNYTITNVIDGVFYYKIPFKFGVLDSGQFNPNILQKIGEAGDYLSVDQLGNLDILTEANFLLKNPNLNKNKST